MYIFLWTMIAIFTLSIIAKLYSLVTLHFPTQKPIYYAIDIIIYILIIIWALLLIYVK